MSAQVAASTTYWEQRAQRFAREGAGLRAVCSYGMPWFYNAAIHLTQWLALRRLLRVPPGSNALDVGCGIGRWSRLLARNGASVTGIDLAPTMVDEANRRSQGAGLDCSFRVEDVAHANLERQFSTIVGVTVLQHIMDDTGFTQALRNLAGHLADHGRIVLLEAAPTRRSSRCDTAIFRARDLASYREAFQGAGLRCIEMTGVDPAPFKTLFLPYYRSLPRPLANFILFWLTLLSLPIDALLGRRWSRASWHKVFVLEKAT
jgi:2-polyprenyl-3-methyl-5-hydroxy-6-metoxy-1,4-benzoquinol methylase